MSEQPGEELRFREGATAALKKLMDQYGAQLVARAIANKAPSPSGELDVTAEDLQSVAEGAVGPTAANSMAETLTVSRRASDDAATLRLVTMLRVGMVIGVVILCASALTLAAILLPKAVDDTSARVWIGIGLFGLAMVFLGATGLFALRQLGDESVRRLLRFAEEAKPQDDDDGAVVSPTVGKIDETGGDADAASDESDRGL